MEASDYSKCMVSILVFTVWKPRIASQKYLLFKNRLLGEDSYLTVKLYNYFLTLLVILSGACDGG